MSRPSASQPVRRRHVFYVSGFDPKGPAHYHRMYTDEAALASAVGGYSAEVGKRRKLSNHSAGWSVHYRGGAGDAADARRRCHHRGRVSALGRHRARPLAAPPRCAGRRPGAHHLALPAHRRPVAHVHPQLAAGGGAGGAFPDPAGPGAGPAAGAAGGRLAGPQPQHRRLSVPRWPGWRVPRRQRRCSGPPLPVPGWPNSGSTCSGCCAAMPSPAGKAPRAGRCWRHGSMPLPWPSPSA